MVGNSHRGRRSRVLRRTAALGAVTLSAAGAMPAVASADPIDPASCTTPALSQAFAAWNDLHWYALVPGQSGAGFDGTGWTLSDGAQVLSTVGADGSSTSVLDLPSGASAVSPPMCVNNLYPTARMMLRDVVGGDAVGISVSYLGTPSWDKPKSVGQLKGKRGWAAGAPINIQPQKTGGWQIVEFTLVGGGKSSEFQVYDFYVDPYAKR
jgi:hypothetical protein